MSAPPIELDRISVHRAGRPALREVSWTLQPGEHWGFAGPNGSGKSTLLRVIAGEQWIDPGAGRRTYAIDRRRIAYVGPEAHERYARLDLPVDGRAIVGTGIDGSTYLQRDLDAAEQRTVDALVERLGLAALAERPLRELSFGQVRRFLIGRALAAAPRVLVLDEFSNGLDPDARAELAHMLDTLSDTVQLIVASHREDDFPRAITHHALLAHGRITVVASGAPPATANAAREAGSTAGPQTHDAPIVEIARADVYRGETLVLCDLSFAIGPGEHTAVFGQNGSGKSTFARLVAGTVAPVFGAKLRRFGKPGPFDLWALKRTVVHLSDDLQTDWDMNEAVESAIVSGFTASIGLWHAPDVAQRARAAELISRLELGNLRARRFVELSFGERRKVLIARALVRAPVLLILDEIWNGLDAAFRTRFLEILRELAATGTTLLAIAHHEGDLPPGIERRLTIEGGRLTPFEPYTLR